MSFASIAATAAALVVAGGGLFGAVGWLATKTVKMVRRAGRFLDEYEGTPARPGVEARPGIMERLASNDEQMAAQTKVLEDIRHQVYANSGHSMFDKVNALWADRFPDRAAAGGPASP